MKKSKLLIPALSIASVGAIVAPMVTSCAKTVGISYQFYKDGTKADDYKAKFEAKAAGTPFENKHADPTSPATLAYFKDVKENPAILADDIMLQVNTLLPKSRSEYTNFSLDINNVNIGSLRMIGEDITLLSLNVNLYLEKTVNGDTMRENTNFVIKNFIPSIGFSSNNDKPAIYFNPAGAAELAPLVSPSFAMGYKCVDKNDKVLYDINAKADNVVDLVTLLEALEDIKDEFDDAINALITILCANQGSSTTEYPYALKSAYFANQTQKDE